MFCSKCGTQFADGSAFCPSCGQPVNAAPQQPQQPAPQQNAPAGDLVATLKKNYTMILAVVALLAFVMFFLTTFQILKVRGSVSFGGSSESAYVSATDVDDFTMGIIGNVIAGLCSLVAAAIGILYFLKEKNKMPYYDQYIAKNLKGMSPGFIMGVIGAIGIVLQFILLLTEGESQNTIFGKASVSYSLNWLSWVTLGIYAALAAVDFFVINKKK